MTNFMRTACVPRVCATRRFAVLYKTRRDMESMGFETTSTARSRFVGGVFFLFLVIALAFFEHA
jgi:hypothetical protein